MKQVDQATYDRTTSVVKVLLMAAISFVITAGAAVTSRRLTKRRIQS